METVVFLVFIVVFLISYLLFKRRKSLKYWEELGVPGPTPQLLFGNLNELRSKTNYQVIEDWTKQYGKTYGYYNGENPILVTSDINLIKEVFVDKHQYFHGRQVLPLPSPHDEQMLAFSSGLTWKRLRAVVSPFFSTVMLKQLTPTIERTVETLIEVLRQKTETEDTEEKCVVELHRIFQAFSLESIAACAYGMDVDFQVNQDNTFLEVVRKLFEMGNFARRSVLLMIAASFPSCRRLFGILMNVLMQLVRVKDPQGALMANVREIVDERRASSQLKNDVLQILLESEVDRIPANLSAKRLTQESVLNAIDTKVERKLNRKEVEAQALLVLASSYETVSNALAFITYELAVNPEFQSKIRQEIEDKLGETITFNDVQRLSYMDIFIREALRKNPFVTGVISRRCMSSCTVGGIPIPTGALVEVDLWSVHSDDEYWGPIDPNILAPERFLDPEKADIRKLAWLAFGVGPRRCIGSKLAMLQTKLCIVRLLQNFELQPCSQTQIPLQLHEAGIVKPRDGITVSLTPRLVK